jgi:hypothetical protein
MKSSQLKSYLEQRNLIVLGAILIIIFIPNHLISQNISTVKEIYNFDTGDIFHFDFDGNGPGYGESSITNIMITGLYYSQNNDTIFYIRKVDREVNSSEYPETKYEHYTDTVFYTNLDSLIHNGWIDTVYSDTNLYHGRKINNYSYSAFDEDSWNLTYVEGCGRTRVIYSSADNSVTSDDKLVYYKKGDEEWGTPNPVSINERSSSLHITKIYPNPSNNYVTVFYKNLFRGVLTIFSLSGKIVKVQNIESELTTIDISELSSGIYLIAIGNGKQKAYEKLIKN